MESLLEAKAKLIAQGYDQEKGLDFEETFVPVACLEPIRMSPAFASYEF